MKRLEIRYLAHFQDLSQKSQETNDFKVDTLKDLVTFLDGKYRGLYDLIIGDDGKLNPRNPVVLNRAGVLAFMAKSPEEKLQSGDCLTFL